MGLGIGRLLAARSWTDLRSRLISACVLGLIALSLTIVGDWPFRLFCCASGIIVFDEWARITGAKRISLRYDVARYGFFLSLLAFLLRFNLVALVLLFLAIVTVAVIGRRQNTTRWLVAGLFYAALASLAPGMLRSDDLAGLAAIGFVICVVWPTDIFAYFTGRSIGGPKILPAISPNKTISGSVGGLAAGVFFGSLFYGLVAGSVPLPIVAFAAALSVLGQAGDFFESWVKRRFGVKDSGRLIPGHGGLMDRVDALIVAIGFAWIVGIAVAGFQHPARAFFLP